MWYWFFMGIAVICSLVIYSILKKQIECLEKQNNKLKYDYEDRILDILYEVKRIENKYATSGTELCRFLEDKIAFHNKKYFKYKNELNITATNENV